MARGISIKLGMSVAAAGLMAAVAVPVDAGSSLNPTLVATLPTPYVSGQAPLYGWGVATMPDGSIAAGDIYNNRVVHYDTSGNNLGVLFTNRGLGANVYGVAVDPNDATIYTGSAQCCGVQVWTTSDHLHYTGYAYAGMIDTTTTNKTQPGNAHYPSRVAVGNDGTVYVADMLTDTISVYSSHATGNVFEGSFGGYGTGPAQFREPRGMALDGSSPQRLYIVDSGNYRISVYDTSQVLNASANHGYIYSFGAQGSALWQFGGNLRGIAYDKTRNLAYVVDMGKNRVEEFAVDPTATTSPLDAGWVQNIGKPDPNLATLSTCCAQPGYFSDGGREDAVDGNGNLWVGDMPNFRDQVFTTTTSPASWSFSFQVPSPSAAWKPPTGTFSYPEGVGVEPDGTAIVSDSHNYRLEWFNTPQNGYAFEQQEGIRGRQNAYGLAYARNISTNTSNSNFAVADTYNNSIHIVQENGTPVCTYGGNGTGPDIVTRPLTGGVKSPVTLPSGVAIDNSGGVNEGLVYVADSAHQRVAVLDESCNYLGQITNTTTPGVAFRDPRGLAVDPTNGDLYVADFSGKKIYHFSIGGAWTISGPAPAVTLDNVITGNMSAPFDVQVDSNYIYASDTQLQKILIFDKATQAYDAASFSVGGQPEGISLAPNGDMYVASRSNDRVFVYCVSNC